MLTHVTKKVLKFAQTLEKEGKTPTVLNSLGLVDAFHALSPELERLGLTPDEWAAGWNLVLHARKRQISVKQAATEYKKFANAMRNPVVDNTGAKVFTFEVSNAQ